MTHTCVSNLTVIGSDNGMSPGRRQAIIWSKFIHFLLKKTHLRLSSAKRRPFCPGGDEWRVLCVYQLDVTCLAVFLAFPCGLSAFSESLVSRVHNFGCFRTKLASLSVIIECHVSVVKLLRLIVQSGRQLPISFLKLYVPWIMGSPIRSEQVDMLCDMYKSYCMIAKEVELSKQAFLHIILWLPILFLIWNLLFGQNLVICTRGVQYHFFHFPYLHVSNNALILFFVYPWIFLP